MDEGEEGEKGRGQAVQQGHLNQRTLDVSCMIPLAMWICIILLVVLANHKQQSGVDPDEDGHLVGDVERVLVESIECRMHPCMHAFDRPSIRGTPSCRRGFHHALELLILECHREMQGLSSALGPTPCRVLI